MKKFSLISLLLMATAMSIILSCKLERRDPACPVISSLSQTGAKYDEIITITGSNFETGHPKLYRISIGNNFVPESNILDVPSSTTMRFKVPKGIGSGPLKVSLASGAGCTSQGLNFIYKYTVTSSDIINPFAGQTGNDACEKCFKNPQGLDVDNNGNIFVADMFHHVIKKINAATRDVTLVAGVINTGDYLDNTTTLAKFKSPTDVAVTGSGDIYVADYLNNCIR